MASMIEKTRYVVMGCSWQGNMTRRDGKLVTCGHQHETFLEAEPCRAKMRKEKPGRCQDYRIARIILREQHHERLPDRQDPIHLLEDPPV